MIGLKYIRKKYGYTMTELAKKMNVTKQMVSLWESGKKALSDDRKQQLAKIFGTEPRWFGEVSEDELIGLFEEKEQVSNTSMYSENENISVLIETEARDSDEMSLRRIAAYWSAFNGIRNPEEIIGLRNKQKEVEKKIHESFLGEIDTNLNDQMQNLAKLIDLYSAFLNIIQIFNKLDPTEKDGSYRRIMDKLKEIQKY